MKVNWALILKDHKGQDILSSDNKALSAGDFVLMLMLAAQSDQDKGASAEEKYKLYKLCRKIMETPDSEFSVEEIALVKKHVGQKAMPWMVGVIFDLLEGSDESK